MMAAGRAAQWFPRFVVLATGIVIGFFAWRTYIDYAPHLYPLEFTQGQWLVAADDGPQGYFRKELYISTPVQQAWISVAATDSFILYVNGKAVDANAYASLNVSGMYDIGPYLQAGKNAVGILVRRRSYPGAAMAIAEGIYVDQTGREQAFATDVAWKFSATEQRQGVGDILWHSQFFDDVAWGPARTTNRPRSAEIYPLAVHPLALTMPPLGKWIGHPNPQSHQASFSRTLTLPSRLGEAWIRIAAAGPYSLVINGVTVTGKEMSRDSSGMRLVVLQGDPIWSNPTGVATDLYHIGPLLKSGANHLTVTTERQFEALPSLFVDGFLISGSEVLTFGSDASWIEPSALQIPDGQRLAQPSSIIRADHNPGGDPLPIKKPIKVVFPVSYSVKQGGRLVLVVSIVVLLTFMAWKGTSRLLYDLRRGDAAESSRGDALTHLPTLLILGGMLLLSFDARFDSALPYQSWVICLAVATLLVLKAAMILESYIRKHRNWPIASPSSRGIFPLAQPLKGVILLSLIVVGAFLRLQGLDAQSLYHDEVHMVSFVKGLFEKGYPNKMIGPIEIPLSTYELVPYPIGLSAALLGFNDFALRLPAALFGIMTIALIYVVGRQVFDSRVGLMAAAIYTFCPQALVWAKYLWHPQQTQFFALLTSYLFYRAIRPAPMSPKYLYLAAIAFIVTYLSWEGAGFLLPALGMGLLVVKGKDGSWLRDKHLWIAVGIVVVVLTLQLVRRILLQVPYLVVGTGLSDVSLPSPFFLDPMYDPTFYFKNFLWLENNAILTLLLIGGLPFLWKQPGVSYYATLLLAILLMMTNLLSRATIRYVYYMQPFLILVACTVAWSLLDRVINLASSSRLQTLWLSKNATIVSILTLVVLATSCFMKLYRLNDFVYPTGIHTRANSYYCDYRTSSQYVRTHFRPGDLIIVVMPEVLRYYVNFTGDYYIQDYTKRQVLFDPVDSSPRYLERMTGLPVIRDIDDFQYVLSLYRKTWIVAAPYEVFSFLSGSEIVKYSRKHGRVVYESYDARIYLLQG
jgi:hypothetical protein